MSRAPALLRRLAPAGRPLAAEAALAGFDPAARAPADRPYVFANMVASVDGRAAFDGRSGPLGGDGDRALFHALRAVPDAVLAGTGTLRTERYGRLVADPDRRRARAEAGLAPDPLAVVLSRSGDVPWDIPLFSDPDQPVLVLSAREVAPPPDCRARVETVPAAAEHGLPAALRRLRARHGVRALLCEGGPRLNRALLAADALDELFLTLAPLLAAGDDPPIVAGAPLRPPDRLELVHALESDGELLLRYRVRPGRSAPADLAG